MHKQQSTLKMLCHILKRYLWQVKMIFWTLALLKLNTYFNETVVYYQCTENIFEKAQTKELQVHVSNGHGTEDTFLKPTIL